MQSKQKKVKWSRGETASALEERTDTGITEVSVAKLQNIISDIYGNISRRPALKIIDYPEHTRFSDETWEAPIHLALEYPESYYEHPVQTCVFTIDANTYIIFIRANTHFGGFLIQNNKFVKKVKITNTIPGLGPETATLDAPLHTAQYNNYMVAYGIYTVPVVLRLTQDNNINIEEYSYSAPWAQPNGTQTKVVDQSVISGLEINHDGGGFGIYTFTDTAGVATVYSWIDTGLTGNSANIAEAIPAGSIVQLPNIGTYMRVEGYANGANQTIFADTTFDGVVNNDGNVPGTGTYAKINKLSSSYLQPYRIDKYVNGILTQSSQNFIGTTDTVTVYNTDSSTGISKANGQSGTWSELTSTKVMMYGALLTPVADETAKDTRLTVEYGFISLQNYAPTTFTFSQQRLYASSWQAKLSDAFPKQIPGFAVGSQIGRYNDFKNDYNQENEPLNIDISTSFQEQIIAMKDYNGLKIFTDSAEYAYSELNGPVKQSENGSKTDCEPIVFGSVLLYADKSNKQIRIMQYEFNANLFNSSTINQFAQEDLIFSTIKMVGQQDKEHCTGHFLYAIQQENSLADLIFIGSEEPRHSMAVCNLTPQNQAMIWSRWDTPKIHKTLSIAGDTYVNIVQNAIEINNKVWFIVELYTNNAKTSQRFVGYTLAELDYEATMDFETEVTPDTTRAVIIPVPDPLYAWTATQDQETITVYTKTTHPSLTDFIYNKYGEVIGTILTTRDGPNTNIGGIDLYAWGYESAPQTVRYYTDAAIPAIHGNLYNTEGQIITSMSIQGVDPDGEWINLGGLNFVDRIFNPFSIKIGATTYICERGDEDDDIVKTEGLLGDTTISVFDGDKYMWDDTLTADGEFTKPLTNLEHPKIGFKIDAELISHPMDIGGKTYTTTKRIARAKMVVRDTEPGAVQINDKYGYMSLDKKIINFYNVTGMKKEVKYIIKNNNGAKFTIESIMFDMEYGTLD